MKSLIFNAEILIIAHLIIGFNFGLMEFPIDEWRDVGCCRVKRNLASFACLQDAHLGVVWVWGNECDVGIQAEDEVVFEWEEGRSMELEGFFILNLIWNAPLTPAEHIRHWAQSVFKRFSVCNARFEIENILFWFSIRNYVFIPMKCQMYLGIMIHLNI